MLRKAQPWRIADLYQREHPEQVTVVENAVTEAIDDLEELGELEF